MRQHELHRYHALQFVVEHRLTDWVAALGLGLSLR